MKIRDTRRLGLVEIEIDPAGQVILTLHPPGKDAAQVIMPPDSARGLATGLFDAAEQANDHPHWQKVCPYCRQGLAVTEVPGG